MSAKQLGRLEVPVSTPRMEQKTPMHSVLRVRTILVLTVLAVSIAVAVPACRERSLSKWHPTPPPITSTVLTFAGGPLHIGGSNLGNDPQGVSHYLLFENGENTIKIFSDDPLVRLWRDDQIVADLPLSIDSTYFVTVVADGAEVVDATGVDLEVYEFLRYSVPRSAGAHYFPIDLAFDGTGRLWSIGEYTNSVYSLDVNGQSLFPHTPETPTGIFRSGKSSEWSAIDVAPNTESVWVSSSGVVWFSQTGSYGYPGEQINASRVVRYDAQAESFSCFSIPSNNAGVWMVLVDEVRGWVWASAAGLSEGNFIVRFKPETFTGPEDTSCDRDFSEAPPVRYCTGARKKRCFQRYDLPTQQSVPARMLLDPQGELWVAEFFGGKLAKLDPATGTFTEFPLPVASGPSDQSALLGPGPWDLLLDGNGDLLISEGFDSEIVQFDPSAGEVVAEYGIPGIDREVEFLHSMSADGSGNVWFGVYATDKYGGQGRVGRLTLSGEMQMFPPLTQLGIAGGASGVRVSPSGEIWAALFWEQGVGRFVRY